MCLTLPILSQLLTREVFMKRGSLLTSFCAGLLFWLWFPASIAQEAEAEMEAQVEPEAETSTETAADTEPELTSGEIAFNEAADAYESEDYRFARGAFNWLARWKIWTAAICTACCSKKGLAVMSTCPVRALSSRLAARGSARSCFSYGLMSVNGEGGEVVALTVLRLMIRLAKIIT